MKKFLAYSPYFLVAVFSFYIVSVGNNVLAYEDSHNKNRSQRMWEMIKNYSRGDRPGPKPTPDPMPEPSPNPDPMPEPQPNPDPVPTPNPGPSGNPTNPYPNASGIEPYAGAPNCAEVGITHNSTQFHGVWDYENGCYWTHSHNADPADLDNIFGAWVFDNLISYPHQTPHENEMKHAGYKWYNLNTNGECDVDKEIPNSEGCVTAMRIQYHAIGSELGVKTRFHSYYAQVQVKNPDGTFGTVSTGGHADFGILHNPYKNTHCALESDPESFNILQPPYRALHGFQGVASWNSGINGGNKFTGYNRIVKYDWTDYDDWTHESSCASYADDELEFICSDPTQCEFNHSETRFYEVVVQIPPELQNGGKVNYTGYTDLAGNVVDTCTQASETCVPLTVENVDSATDHVFRVATGGAANNPNAFPYDVYGIDYDVSPVGVYWLQYPN